VRDSLSHLVPYFESYEREGETFLYSIVTDENLDYITLLRVKKSVSTVESYTHWPLSVIQKVQTLVFREKNYGTYLLGPGKDLLG